MFIVPVHGRLGLSAICLRQLRRTCDALGQAGICASAVIVGDAFELDALGIRGLGFGSVAQDNHFLGRKFNDGIQLATDPTFNPAPADYVIPCGSDDWIDHRVFLDLPAADTIVGFQQIGFVREDASELVPVTLNYTGGSGIRIIPRQLVKRLDYRPADEDRPRACDTSILRNIRVEFGDDLRIEHRYLHDYQVVDWKTPDEQLNPFDSVVARRPAGDAVSPWEALEGVYPAAALDEMRAHYDSVLVAA
jgi:hypothetical protein